MFKKNVHVGRPSNEEIRNRRIKKVLSIVISITLICLVVVLIITGSLSKLMGNSITEYYCFDNTYTLEGDKCVKEMSVDAAILGDINSDNKVDKNDLDLLSKYINYSYYEEEDDDVSKLSELQIVAADVTQNGSVFYEDETALKSYLERNVGSLNSYQEEIGVKRVCLKGYTLNGNKCVYKETMPAVKEEHSVDANDNNKENNVNTNNNTNTNTNAITNTEQNNNSNTTNESVNNNQDTNTVDNPVVVTFKPEGNATGVSANKKYNINVIFDVKDTSKTYYYIWKNYFYDEVNYRTECKKVVPGEHKGSFTVNGKRKANVTVYSDSSCTSEVTSVDSKTYTCRGGCPNDVDATFKPQNSVTSISKDTNYKINIDFKIRDKAHSYYYIWSNYLNGSNNYNTKCTKVTEGEHEGSFTVNGTRKVNVTLYRDASCQKKIKTIESKTYKCSNCPPLTISVGRNLSSSQTNGTVINNGFIFNIIDNTDTYYYKWRTYNNGSLWVEGSCVKVPTNGKQEVRDLTINSDLRVRKGTITVYSDSSCKNRIYSVPIAETTTYRCSNCNETNSGGSTWSNFWSSSGSGSSSSSGKSNSSGSTSTKQCPSDWKTYAEGLCYKNLSDSPCSGGWKKNGSFCTISANKVAAGTGYACLSGGSLRTLNGKVVCAKAVNISLDECGKVDGMEFHGMCVVSVGDL